MFGKLVKEVAITLGLLVSTTVGAALGFAFFGEKIDETLERLGEAMAE